MSALPNDEDLAIYEAAAKEAEANGPLCLAALVKAHMEGAVQPTTARSWCTLARIDRPELFNPLDAKAAAADTERAELARRAFEGVGSMSERGRLVRKVGEVEADAIARTYGLTNLHDRSRPGVKPGQGEDEAAVKARNEARANPWSAAGWNITKQGQLLKAMGEVKAAAMAGKVGSYIGATKPAAA